MSLEFFEAVRLFVFVLGGVFVGFKGRSNFCAQKRHRATRSRVGNAKN